MAAVELLYWFVLLQVFLGGNVSFSDGGGPRSESGQQYYAAVFLNRSHVSVGASANIGLFRRDGDSTWANIYRPNLYTFGIGLWKRGSTRRYYVAGGNGLHRSDDAMKSWRVLTDWRTEEILSVAQDPVDSALLFVSTPWGVFRSTDDGKSWQRAMRGMKKNYVQKVVIDRSDRRTLYACVEDDLYRSTDQGEHWTALHAGVRDVMNVLQHPLNPQHLLVGTEDHGVRVSTDGGMSWSSGGGLPNTAFYGLAVSSDGKTLYAGGYLTGLWKSTDGGATWSLLWQHELLEAIYTVFVDPADPHHLMVGTSGQGIFESYDEGRSWKHAGLRGCHVKQIELYP